MLRHAAFLRGINLGGRRVTMDQLRAAFEQTGLGGVATFIASGNVVFDHSGSELGDLEARIEGTILGALGFEAETFVRSLVHLDRLGGSTLIAQARDEGFVPHVIFLRREPAAEVRAALGSLETADDRFPVLGREVLWLRRGRLTDSTIRAGDLERSLGRAENTMRKLNTIERMVAKFGS